MLTRQDAILAAARSARRFLADNQAALASVDLTAACKRLDDVITSFTTHAYEQDLNHRSAKGETEKQRQLRLTLRSQQMAPIAEVARRNLSRVPEFKALQLPPRSAKGEAFLASAKAMADAASKYKDALLERGLPGDFLDQFEALLAAFASSVADREQNRIRRMGATKGLAFEDQEARSVLKVLDALVHRAIGDNATLLGTWGGARKIYYRSGAVTKTTGPTTQAAPTDAPASSTSTAATVAPAA